MAFKFTARRGQDEPRRRDSALQTLLPKNTSTYSAFYWVAVKELEFSYHNSDTILFTIYPYSGNFHFSSLTATQSGVSLAAPPIVPGSPSRRPGPAGLQARRGSGEGQLLSACCVREAPSISLVGTLWHGVLGALLIGALRIPSLEFESIGTYLKAMWSP